MSRHQGSARAEPAGASPLLTLGDQEPARSVRVLDPIARASEVLFGLIMALTFTGTLSVATAGREEVRGLLIAMVGCNLAWGLVDGVMFLIASLTERGHGLLTMRAVQSAATPAAAHRIISSAVPPIISPLLTTADLERIRRGLQRTHDVPARAALNREDWLGALAVFLLVFLSTFPLVVPFLLFDRVHLALRISNAIAIVMLFGVGYWLAQHSGHHPWRTALGMVCLGLVLVGIAIALGG